MDNNEDIIKKTQEMQQVVEQMYLDDVAENPDIVHEHFDCSACGQTKSLAGSILYKDYRLCNDCVLYAELGFGLKKFKDVQDLIDAMEEKRLEEICNFIKQDEAAQNN